MNFEDRFHKLSEFYILIKEENIYEYIKDNKNLIDLLNITRPHLKEAFPQGKFELEMFHDLSGEGNDHLLLNIYVDHETFNNGFMDKIYDIDMKILPFQKEMGLVMALNLMPRLNTN